MELQTALLAPAGGRVMLSDRMVGTSSPALCPGHSLDGTLSGHCVPDLHFQACLNTHALGTAHTLTGGTALTPDGICLAESCPRFSGAVIYQKPPGILHQNESSPLASIPCHPGLLS